MSNCKQLVAQFKSTVPSPSKLLDEAAKLRAEIENATDPAQIQQIVDRAKAFDTANDYVTIFNQYVKPLLTGPQYDSSSKEYCEELVSLTDDWRGAWRINLSRVRDAARLGEAKIAAQTQAQASQKASTSTNNAGTGTPGTAGTGPGATPAPAPSPTTVANATPTANTTATTTATGTSAPAAVPPTTGANANTATTTTGTGTTKPATVNPATGTAAPAKPATKPVPTTKGAPGTVEYISSLIAQKPTEAENILATACPDKAAAITKVKAILSNLGGAVAAQIPTAKAADGTAASAAAKSALSTELQSALSKVGTTLKSIEALDCAKQAAGAAPAAGTSAPYSTDTNKGLSGATDNTRAQANRQDAANYALEGDWRVRLALAPGAQYIYDLPDSQPSGILAPLRATDGVIFPYTPTINVTYAANYEPAEVVHNNYKIWQYKNSSVDNVSITADFTAQDTHEANYLLAVIHFFRTVTKMFYGKDQDPKAGTPPPLCYLYGLGQFQFNMHPLLLTNFTYVLPADVDYIRATTNVTTAPLVNKSPGNTPNDTNNPSNQRMSQSPSSVAAGGVPSKPTYSTVSSGTVTPTYVPTKISLTIQCIPIVARNDISQGFSLKEYATGKLLVGKDRPGRGGIW